jgi:hypothetical protein
VNEWLAIPGTAGAGGLNVTAFSGMALREATSEIVIAATGGHSDGNDNSVISLPLAADAPAWVTLKGPSQVPAKNVSHYADGTPSSRHLYHSIHVIESLHRVFLFGAQFTFGEAYTFPDVDAFDLNTKQWDPAGTWAPIPSGGGYGVVRIRGSEDVLTNGLALWSAATQTWSQPVTSLSGDGIRFPIAHDSLRNQLFSLQWADGWGYGEMKLSASRFALPLMAQVSITFNDSPALAQFKAEMPSSAGMDYDPDNDRFLFYCGQAGGEGRVYVVTPNATTMWDMSILPLGPGSVTPPAVGGAGVLSRFRYVPALKGFVLLPTNGDNLFFLRSC